MIDLAIVGGGPAGATAAWAAARRGWRVIVLERGEYPRDKVCGEYFSAEALPLLHEMAPELAAAAPPIATAVFVSAKGRQAAFRLPEAARGISRLALDAALWSAAGAAGAELRARTPVTAMVREGSGFRLAAGVREEISARALIVAAGRWWRIAGLGGPIQPKSLPWLGVKAHFRGLPRAAAVEMYCFRGGYCGLAPVENGWTNACCLIRRERAGDLAASRDFARWMAGVHPILAERLRGGEQASVTVVTAPVEVGPRAAVWGGALLAGDASGFIDPFTGDGMARAMLSGRLAAELAGNAGQYAAAMAAAAGRSYRASGWLRAVVGAPGWLQEVALWGLARPAAGPRWVTATRWRRL